MGESSRSRGEAEMREAQIGREAGRGSVDRRDWMRLALASAAVGGAGLCLDPAAIAQNLAPAAEADKELQLATDRIKTVTRSGLRTVRSDRFQAVGDAADQFMKLTLSDCESIALDYLAHYQTKGFDVKQSNRRLTLVVFLDERPYGEFLRRYTRGVPLSSWGFYSRADNWLVLFDFRNVPVSERGAGLKNMKTLAHETTHLLAFNTGLLNRKGDSPRAIVEGLALYGETRRLHGRNEPGHLNVTRLDDLAHILRRQKWISAVDLLTDDAVAFGNNSDRWLLAYAQSWLLVYHLMTTPARLANFQAYLKTIYGRTSKNHRFEDAERHFGDLERLDQELRRDSIRLQQVRGT
jgi:Protein of unknown function (DUF1570)